MDLISFARGFASNRSVKSLTIYCEEQVLVLANGEALGALLPFFMNNSAFKSLHIMNAKSTCLHVLASILRQFDTLTGFTLSTTNFMITTISTKAVNYLRNIMTAKTFPRP